MKAIQTKYLGPTNHKGARIKAWADGWGSVIISYPHEYNAERAHYAGAVALIDNNKARWERHGCKFYADYPTISGGLPNGDWCFCYAESVVSQV